MLLRRSDFWPIFQGGWEPLSGYLVPVPAMIVAMEAETKASFASHPDLVDAEDDLDVLSFLEERLTELSMPAPERVIHIGEADKNIRGMSTTLLVGYYAFWTLDDWVCSEKLRNTLAKTGSIGPAAFQVKYPRWVPAGADILIWLFIAIMILFIAEVACV